MQDFDEIYRQNFTDVYKFAVSLCRDPVLAEEITQETFFKALRQIDRFKGESRLSTWLCRIARNVYIDHTRRRELADDPLLEQLPDGIDLTDQLADKEAAYAIYKNWDGELLFLKTDYRYGDTVYGTVDLLADEDVSASRLLVFQRDMLEFLGSTEFKIGAAVAVGVILLIVILTVSLRSRRNRRDRRRGGYRGRKR